MNEQKIARINALAQKQREGLLTDEEKQEQTLLRREFVDFIKSQVKDQLKQVHAQEKHANSTCNCHHH